MSVEYEPSIVPTPAEIEADMFASFWLKGAVKALVARDCLDAARDAAILAAMMARRCDEILDRDRGNAALGAKAAGSTGRVADLAEDICQSIRAGRGAMHVAALLHAAPATTTAAELAERMKAFEAASPAAKT